MSNSVVHGPTPTKPEQAGTGHWAGKTCWTITPNSARRIINETVDLLNAHPDSGRRAKCTASVARDVYADLAEHADPAGRCYPHESVVAQECRGSEPQVRRALRVLSVARLVEITPRLSRGNKIGNNYRLFHSPEAYDAAHPPPVANTADPIARSVHRTRNVLLGCRGHLGIVDATDDGDDPETVHVWADEIARRWTRRVASGKSTPWSLIVGFVDTMVAADWRAVAGLRGLRGRRTLLGGELIRRPADVQRACFSLPSCFDPSSTRGATSNHLT